MWFWLIRLYVLLGLLPSVSGAQIVLDGSLGPSGPLPGPHVTIPAEVGQRRDTNLFHSFSDFNVPTCGSATFTGPDEVENILGRVTGANPSTIDGRIGTDIPNANLYLFNPNGMLFGPNATLDLDGSFSASTADFLRLADGVIFSADLSHGGQLSSAPLAAFGFWRSNPAAMEIRGSRLEVGEGSSLSMVAGTTLISGATLRAPSGELHLASAGGAGEIPIGDVDQANIGQPMSRYGDIGVLDGSMLDVSGDPGGQVIIEGGRFLLDSSVIVSQTQGELDGAEVGIDINMTGDMLVDNRSVIRASASGSGRPGDTRLNVGSLTLRDQSQIGNAIIENFPIPTDGDPRARAEDNGGSVTVVAREAIVLEAGFITSI